MDTRLSMFVPTRIDKACLYLPDSIGKTDPATACSVNTEGWFTMSAMRLRSQFISLLILFLLFVATSSHSAPSKKLTCAEAVRAAEKFIAVNGYTDLPPTDVETELSYESIEWEKDTRKMLEQRRDTLERRAYGYIVCSRRGAGWTVVFRYKYKDPSVSVVNGRPIIHLRSDGKSGRAVTVDPFGRGMRVEHVDIFLKACVLLNGNGAGKHSPIPPSKKAGRR